MKFVNTTTCIDCGVSKGQALHSGTFMCNDCFEVFAKRMKQKTGEGDKDMSINAVRELMDEGLKAKEIAGKVGLSVASVYSYMSKIRNEDKEEVPKVKKSTNKNKEKELQAKLDYQEDKHRLEIEMLKETNRVSGEKIIKLKDEIKVLKDNTEDPEYVHLESRLKLAVEQLDDARERANQYQDQFNKIVEELNKEKAKNKHLIGYLTLELGQA